MKSQSTLVIMELLIWSTVMRPSQKTTIKRHWLKALHKIQQIFSRGRLLRENIVDADAERFAMQTVCLIDEGMALLTLMAPMAVAIWGNKVLMAPKELGAINALQYHGINEAVLLLGESLKRPYMQRSSLTLRDPHSPLNITALFAVET